MDHWLLRAIEAMLVRAGPQAEKNTLALLKARFSGMDKRHARSLWKKIICPEALEKLKKKHEKEELPLWTATELDRLFLALSRECTLELIDDVLRMTSSPARLRAVVKEFQKVHLNQAVRFLGELYEFFGIPWAEGKKVADSWLKTLSPVEFELFTFSQQPVRAGDGSLAQPDAEDIKKRFPALKEYPPEWILQKLRKLEDALLNALIEGLYGPL